MTYVKNVRRVSDLVSFVYPFEGNSKERYEGWLSSKGILNDDYMDVAQTHWTYIHQVMEDYMLWKEEIIWKLHKVHSNEIEEWKKYIDDLKARFPDTKWVPEAYVIDNKNRFQGTADLVRINWNKVFLYDYKTYEIAKKHFNLPQKLNKNWTPPKPTDKLKKVSLQLSLYAETYKQLWYEIGWIYLVWIHSSWVHEYEAELYSSEKLEEIIKEFLYHKNYNIENEEYITF